ncbi:MAG: hypothetical protein C0469_07180 [Cyanobacteria bacterium DS2.3.42]|nr:hypothetical protein [Cyanobacteria bacterium DS2.3.42]
MLMERGKPHGLSPVQRVIEAQATTNAQEVTDSGGSKRFAVMAMIGFLTHAEKRLTSRERPAEIQSKGF